MLKKIPHRFRSLTYCVEMERDLFGDVVLRRRWYSLRTRQHGGKQQVFSEEVAAIKVIEAVERTRIRKGYRLVRAGFPQ